jgi:hypothetical protein
MLALVWQNARNKGGIWLAPLDPRVNALLQLHARLQLETVLIYHIKIQIVNVKKLKKMFLKNFKKIIGN